MAGRQQPRKIVVNGTEFRWFAKGHGPCGRWIGSWSPKTLRLVVTAPSGASFRMELHSKNWGRIHDYNREDASPHLAALRPAHIRTFIQQALKAGWSPISRRSIVLVPEDIPEADYGPQGAPKEGDRPSYLCMHGIRGDCSWCLDGVPFDTFSPMKAECLVCFKESPYSETLVFRNVLPPGWLPVHYSNHKFLRETGIVCSGRCEERFHTLMRQGLPSVYDHMRANTRVYVDT